MNLSPFSLNNDWVVHWNRLPSNFREGPILGQVPDNEQEALKAIASIGVISSNQMFNLFNLNKNRLNRMVKRHRLVEHKINLNEEHHISLYTLGVNGAKIVGVSGYKVNYWVEYTINDIIKRLLFFSFYERFYPANLLPTTNPFVGSILINDNPIYIYVLRGDVNDLMMYLKWNEFHERLIIITESLQHLNQLKPFLNDIKLRVILDQSVLDKDNSLKGSFYLFRDNEFMPETQG